MIDRYRSAAVSDDTMLLIRPFLHAAIAASAVVGKDSARKHCNHLTRIAVYAMERGVALEVHRVLTTAFIDDYVRCGMADEGESLRAERRRRLLAMAATANPGADAPAKLAPIGHRPVKPCYPPTELAVIVRACRVQPTQARQRDLGIVVSLAAGAGLDSVDMRHLFTDHVEDLGDGGIRIHVQLPRPRVVPLRAGFETLLRGAMTGKAPGELLLGHKQDRLNTAARATERAALHNIPSIDISRLRATWLADLMTDVIPLAVILQAAGLKSARTLSELQPHLGPWLEHKGIEHSPDEADPDDAASRILRGESQ